MSNWNNVPQFYWSDYPNNPGVRLVCESSYPNNPDVLSVGLTSDYPNNSDVMHVHRSNYPNNPGVQLIYMTGCFPKSELVQTCFDEWVPIGSLKIGDRISSFDLEKNKNRFTAITGIHKYSVNDIICLNNTIQVSSSHPFMIIEKDEKGNFTPKWKVAFDVIIGDYIFGSDGKLTVVKTKNRKWYPEIGIEVLNLSTDSGVPFLVGNFVVRAENAKDTIEWAKTPLTQKLAA